jgi:diaminopimelate epimerase
MDYRNADGSIAEMCGNGVRVLAAHLQRAGHVEADSFAVLTRAGVRTVEILERPAAPGAPWGVRVGMGASRATPEARTVTIAGHRLAATDVDMGNPHAVAFLPGGVVLEDLDLTRRPALDPEPADGANIELVSHRGPRHVAMRVHERGVGETRSCGTGVAAVAVAAALRAGDDSRLPWTVDVPGGRLEVGWTPSGEVTLSGPARLVADGTTLVHS